MEDIKTTDWAGGGGPLARIELLFRFRSPVEGTDPVMGDRFSCDRHRVRLTTVIPGPTEVLALDGDEIVERWPVDVVVGIHPVPGSGSGGLTLAEKRRRHKRAYERWTDDEDDELRDEHGAGRTVAEMAAAHQRNRGAIEARRVRLGLVDPIGGADVAGAGAEPPAVGAF